MLTAPTSLGIIFFPAYDWAISPTHPEREERLLYTQDQFEKKAYSTSTVSTSTDPCAPKTLIFCAPISVFQPSRLSAPSRTVFQREALSVRPNWYWRAKPSAPLPWCARPVTMP